MTVLSSEHYILFICGVWWFIYVHTVLMQKFATGSCVSVFSPRCMRSSLARTLFTRHWSAAICTINVKIAFTSKGKRCFVGHTISRPLINA